MYGNRNSFSFLQDAQRARQEMQDAMSVLGQRPQAPPQAMGGMPQAMQPGMRPPMPPQAMPQAMPPGMQPPRPPMPPQAMQPGMQPPMLPQAMPMGAPAMPPQAMQPMQMGMPPQAMPMGVPPMPPQAMPMGAPAAPPRPFRDGGHVRGYEDGGEITVNGRYDPGPDLATLQQISGYSMPGAGAYGGGGGGYGPVAPSYAPPAPPPPPRFTPAWGQQAQTPQLPFARTAGYVGPTLRGDNYQVSFGAGRDGAYGLGGRMAFAQGGFAVKG